MNNSVVEFDVLAVLLAYVRVGLNRTGLTYSFSDRNVVLESRDCNDLVVAHADFDDLAASDIGIGGVIEKRGGEGRGFCDVLRAELANENVVVQQSLEEAFLRDIDTRAVQRAESLIGRSQQCDVLSATKRRCKLRLALQQINECAEVLIAAEDRGEVGRASIFLLSSSRNDCNRSEESLSELHDEYASK